MRPRLGGLLTAGFLALPVAVGLAYAVAGALGLVGPGAAGFSLARVTGVLGEDAVWRGLGWTVWTAGASTLLAAGAGGLLAVVFRGAHRSDRLGRSLTVLPLPVPHLVAALLGAMILSQSGLLARVAYALGVIDGPSGMPALINDRWGWGLILSLTWKEIPFLALAAASVLDTRGNALEDTARTLGAGRWAILRRVTWPLVWRGMLPSIVAVFAFVAGSYETAALLAPSDPLPLPLLTYERYTDASLARRGDAFVLTLVMLGIAFLAVLLHELAVARWRDERR